MVRHALAEAIEAGLGSERLALPEQKGGGVAMRGGEGGWRQTATGRNDEMILTRKIALGVAGVAAAGVLGTAGVAAATSSDSTPAPSASAAPSSPATPPGDKAHHRKGKRAERALIGRGMHGEWVVKGKDGKPVTLETIRGTVTAVGSSRLTVKADDGFTETFTTNSDTKVRGGAHSLGEVKVGAKGAVVGVKSGATITARAVLVRK
jgi:hypothetical protein